MQFSFILGGGGEAGGGVASPVYVYFDPVCTLHGTLGRSVPAICGCMVLTRVFLHARTHGLTAPLCNGGWASVPAFLYFFNSSPSPSWLRWPVLSRPCVTNNATELEDPIYPAGFPSFFALRLSSCPPPWR